MLNKILVDDKIIYYTMEHPTAHRFWYYEDDPEFPICSVDAPNENGDYIAMTITKTKNVGSNFTHENVVRWALNKI